MIQTGGSTMQTFTAVLPTLRLLPHDLALLLAPVAVEESRAPDEYVGRADGVILDDDKHVVAFVVRLAREHDARGPRTLVPATAVTVMQGPVLRISWTEAHLRAQPRLDLPPDDRTDGAPPPSSRRVPVGPGLAPPGPGSSGAEAAKEGLEGGAMGAALGALAGLALGGPIAAASLAVFFAVGGILGGVVAGAAEETKPPAPELPPVDTEGYGPSGAWLGGLEQRLQDPGLEAEGFVTTMRFTPETMTEAPPEHHHQVAGWHKGLTDSRRSA
jgi:hypothetical protein